MITNLGTVAGDRCSESDDINSQGQVVGESGCNGMAIGHAWLWENGGPMIDLNTLIPPGAGIQLQHGVSINDRGEISGDGILPTGDRHAFVLILCDENHADIEDCDYSMVDGPVAIAQTTPAVRGASSRSLPQSVLRPMNRYPFRGLEPRHGIKWYAGN